MEVKLIRCETCLSSDRHLVCLSTLESIIYEIQLNHILSTDGGICWECNSIILKFYNFRTHVLQAQDVLSRNIENQQIKTLSYLSKEVKNNYDFEYTYNYDPLATGNGEQNLIDVKTEPILIKQEDDTHFENSINSDTDYDEKPLSMIFADSIGVKNMENEKKRLPKNRRTIKQDRKKFKEIVLKRNNINSKYERVKMKENKSTLKKAHENTSKQEFLHINKKFENEEVLIQDKFETIIFAEEEMLKCREEKRNQSNFKKIPYKCNSCVTGFNKKEKYELHLKKIHNVIIGPHTCSVCQARFASKPALIRHCAKHYLQYRCKLCLYKGLSVAAAVRHAREKHGDDDMGKIHCKQCSYVARTPEELSEHLRTEHSFSCNECGIKFKGRHTLRTHNRRIHAVKREFSCEVCCRTFVNKSRLEAHQAGHNAAAAKRLAYCSLCRIQYKSIYVYRNHLKNSLKHVQERVPCPECDKTFASRVYLKRHYNFYHLSQSQYKCGDCDKLIMSRWRLKIHKQTHHGLSRTREHTCTLCSKKFYTKATLLTHSLLHTDSRAFMCAQCGATFRQSAALYTHVRLLHRDT